MNKMIDFRFHASCMSALYVPHTMAMNIYCGTLHKARSKDAFQEFSS